MTAGGAGGQLRAFPQGCATLGLGALPTGAAQPLACARALDDTPVHPGLRRLWRGAV